jgi:hypothetical protein
MGEMRGSEAISLVKRELLLTMYCDDIIVRTPELIAVKQQYY